MSYWPFTNLRSPCSSTEALELESKMADQVRFAKRVRKSLYYGEYSDASLPSLSVTDVAVEVLNKAVPPRKQLLDRKYAQSVARRAKISPCTLMMGMLYAERLRQRHPHGITALNSSDVFLISIMVASKYLYDEGEEEEVYNEDWAKAGFKTVQDINKLEMDFLQLMDWNLFISKEEFLNFVSQVESKVALNKGCARGWLTYSDMCILLNNKAILDLLQCIQQHVIKNISKFLTAYVFGVSFLLGSSALASLTIKSSQQDTIFPVTPVQPSNCLTTEASCVFSRESTEVAPQDSDLVFRPVSQRIKCKQGSFLGWQGLKNVTTPREPNIKTQEKIPLPSANHIFPGTIDMRFLLHGNLAFLYPDQKRPIHDSYSYLNGTNSEILVQSRPSLYVHEIKESSFVSKVSSFGPQIANKKCSEEFHGSRVSLRELNCSHGQQSCVA